MVFIKLENASSVGDLASLIRKKISEANTIIDNLKSIRNSEDLEITAWHEEVNKAEQRISALQKQFMEMNQ